MTQKSKTNDFVIYTKMLAVCTWLFNKILDFPQKQRLILGQQIEICSLKCIELIVTANESRSGELKIQALDELDVKLEVLRSLLRVAYDLKFFKSAKQLSYIIEQIDEVGKIRGSWVKRYLSVEKASKSNSES